jgi:uroporphyrinogen decarboxylase
MTPRQRWQAVLAHGQADRAPMDYWSTPEFSAKLVRHLGLSDKPESELVADLKAPLCDNNLKPAEGFSCLRSALSQLEVDFVVKLAPRYVGPELPPDTDEFGCRHREISYGTGTYDETVTSPLARFGSVAEIEANYQWPQPDWWDYSTIAEQARGWEHHPIRAGGSEPFLTYKELRGEVQAYIDLKRNPEIVHYCLDKLFGLAYENTRRMLEQLRPATPGSSLPPSAFVLRTSPLVLCYISEDLGSQQGLLIAPAHIREFLLPRMRRMVELARSHDAVVFHHDDGAIARILPDLIELGIQILNPVQWRTAGMDRAMLKSTWGNRVVFHGAMDNQRTLPFGTVEDIRAEVQENIRTLGAGGGYILAPCHNLQPITPVENVLALYDACRGLR